MGQLEFKENEIGNGNGKRERENAFAWPMISHTA